MFLKYPFFHDLPVDLAQKLAVSHHRHGIDVVTIKDDFRILQGDLGAQPEHPETLQHGCHQFPRRDQIEAVAAAALAADVPTLATVLRERGYATGAFVASRVLDRRFGLARGFEVYDDRMAAELRLWHALDQQLLCPFQYFGIADGTDLRNTGWQAGRYVTTDLDNIYTGNHIRARTILRALHDTIEDPLDMRALGFCVSIAHAEFMAAQFNAAGIPAAALTTNSDDHTRDTVLARLPHRDLWQRRGRGR